MPPVSNTEGTVIYTHKLIRIDCQFDCNSFTIHPCNTCTKCDELHEKFVLLRVHLVPVILA